MYNQKDSINQAYNYIQDLRAKGKGYGGYPVYNVSKADLEKLAGIANKYGFPFEWLVNLINFESGRTFNPAITNSIGATGLIQFMTTIGGKKMTYAKADGSGVVGTDALRKMTFSQQLDYIDGYLSRNLKKVLKPDGKVMENFTQGDLFMTIFYPVSVGKPDFVFPEVVSKANAGIKKPFDYTERALKVAIFPIALFPYTLDDFKKKFSEVVQFGKRNIVPLLITLIGISGLAFYLYKTKKLPKL
jgi:hypothetical protein